MSRPPTVISRGLAWWPVESLHWIPADPAQHTGMGNTAPLGNKVIYLCQRQPNSPIHLSPELSSNRDQVLLHTKKVSLISNFLPLGKPPVHAIREPKAAPPKRQYTIGLLISGLWFLHETRVQNRMASPSLNVLVMWTSPLNGHASQRWQFIDVLVWPWKGCSSSESYTLTFSLCCRDITIIEHQVIKSTNFSVAVTWVLRHVLCGLVSVVWIHVLGGVNWDHKTHSIPSGSFLWVKGRISFIPITGEEKAAGSLI